MLATSNEPENSFLAIRALAARCAVEAPTLKHQGFGPFPIRSRFRK